DDGSSQGFGTTGSWVSFGGQGYHNSVHYVTTAGSGANVASWTFSVTPGQYRISATWSPLSNRASNAPYQVLDGSTPLTTVTVNQQVAPSGLSDQGVNWQDLGTYTISGSQLVVQLSDNANGQVIADAIRVERTGNLPTVQVLDGVSSIANG